MEQHYILDTLIDNGFSKKEAQVYIASLKLGSAPISSIARTMWENRVTIYATMKNLIAKGLALSTIKNKTTYYTVISPQEVTQKTTEKAAQLNSILPDIMALASKVWMPVKTQFYEWLEGLKTAYKQIILSGWEMEDGEPFLTMVWTTNIDEAFQRRLEKEFIPWRLTFPRKTRAIIASVNGAYTQYSYSNHETIVIDNPIFDFTNEIVIYGKDKVAILMYASQELSALLIQSQTLHNTLKAMFNFTWENQKSQAKAIKPRSQKLQKKR
jgi:predicted transcriptional regulator